MRLVARLRSGRLVYYAAGVFYLDGNGSISHSKLRKLDTDGSIEWLDDDLRVDFRTQTGEQGPEGRRVAAVVRTDEAAHRFSPLRAAKKFAIAAAAFVVFLTFVAGMVVYSSARSVAEERVVSQREVEAAEARIVYSAYYDVLAVTEKGVRLSGYTPALKRARAARAEFEPGDSATREIDERLAEAERLYAGADEIWRLQSSSNPDASFDEYKQRRGDLGLTATDPNDAIQELWGRAYDHVTVALADLNAYEGLDAEESEARPDVTMAQISQVLMERFSLAEPPEPAKTSKVRTASGAGTQ